MIYWILLILAIIAEITGTLSMKWASVNDSQKGFILMLAMIALSYIFLSFAVKKLPSVWRMQCGKALAYYSLPCSAYFFLMNNSRY